MKRLSWFPLLILVLAIGVRSVSALDPARALTQYQNDR
jgi:hypothetical protein